MKMKIPLHGQRPSSYFLLFGSAPWYCHLYMSHENNLSSYYSTLSNMTKKQATTATATEAVVKPEYKDNVSSRGLAASTSSPLPYFGQFMEALSNQCSITSDEDGSNNNEGSNPTGYIPLCTAENKLMIKNALSKHLKQHSFTQAAFGTEITYCYNDLRGVEYVREAVARFISRKFIQSIPGEVDEAKGKVGGNGEEKTMLVAKAEQIILSCGAASVINMLSYTLAEENDVVLIPAPYYAAFDFDTSMIAKLSTYPVHMNDPTVGPQPSELEAVYQKLTSQGRRVRMLLLTNPNNPLGTIYPDSVIRNCVNWSRSKGMQTIVDEIYALSVHDKNNNKFHSVSKILNNKLGNDVHLVWALSKDFGSSGFRVGVLYTQNETVISAAGNINLFSGVSHPMQAITAELLSDDDFVDSFLDESNTLLKASLKIVTDNLEKMGIPFVKAEAGIFIYCDFSSLLPEDSFEGEEKFSNIIFQYARVVMTPGSSQKENRPGFFRICYAFVTPEVLKVAMSRLQILAKLLKEHGWENVKSNIDKDMILKCSK